MTNNSLNETDSFFLPAVRPTNIEFSIVSKLYKFAMKYCFLNAIIHSGNNIVIIKVQIKRIHIMVYFRAIE